MTGVFSLAVGPVAAALALTIDYAFGTVRCGSSREVHFVVIAIALLATGAGLVRASAARQRPAASPGVRFLVDLSVLTNALFIAVIVAFLLPPLLLNGCR